LERERFFRSVRNKRVSSAYRATLCSKSDVLIPLINGWALIAMAKGSIAKRKSPGLSGHPCLVPPKNLKML
jgi:hypothetical protein